MEAVQVLIAAGGSGGHLFPAIHIAEALCSSGHHSIAFVGVGRPAEDVIFKNLPYARFTIKSTGIKQSGFKGLLSFLLNFPPLFFQTWQLFSKVKPKLVIATGGYSAFYPVLIAFLRGIPSIIHEAENKFGLANFFLSLIATKVTLAFETAKAPFWAKTIHTGHPVRKTLLNVRRNAPIMHKPKNILLMGGSQGATAIDRLGLELVRFFAEQGLNIYHQCRAENVESLKTSYSTNKVDAQVCTFIHNMDEVYDWSDIIISRAGAGTVSELAVVNRPAILIPYPFAQGDHQSFNASVLEQSGLACVEKEGNNLVDRVKAKLIPLLELERYNKLLNTKQINTLSAAEQIAELARSLVVR